MANEEQLARLRINSEESNSCVTWNQWRKKNPHIVIDLNHANLSDTNLSSANLTFANLTGADFRGADLTAAHLAVSNLSGVDFRGAHISGADLKYADLTAANLRGADLSSADLSSADLSDGDLTAANLRGANLRGADLTAADLRDADLSGADLRDADLIAANLCDADLHNVDLSGADLSGAVLIRIGIAATNLTGANLSGAHMLSTTLGNLDLRGVVGLATVAHSGPSNLAANAFYASHGEIPDVFLRGCGLPGEMISFVHSINGPIQYYSAFISYNHHDEVFATRLYNDLQMNDVRCWKYSEDMKIGDPIHSRVDEAIRFHDKLLLIFSGHAVQSGWVASEVETALAREKRDNRQVLFPITIDTAITDIHLGWAAEIRRTRNIGNFTTWKDQDQYQPLFDRLLRDLKTDSR